MCRNKINALSDHVVGETENSCPIVELCFRGVEAAANLEWTQSRATPTSVSCVHVDVELAQSFPDPSAPSRSARRSGSREAPPAVRRRGLRWNPRGDRLTPSRSTRRSRACSGPERSQTSPHPAFESRSARRKKRRLRPRRSSRRFPTVPRRVRRSRPFPRRSSPTMTSAAETSSRKSSRPESCVRSIEQHRSGAGWAVSQGSD